MRACSGTRTTRPTIATEHVRTSSGGRAHRRSAHQALSRSHHIWLIGNMLLLTRIQELLAQRSCMISYIRLLSLGIKFKVGTGTTITTLA